MMYYLFRYMYSFFKGNKKFYPHVQKINLYMEPELWSRIKPDGT